MSWQARGACVGKDPALWFSAFAADEAEAKKVCKGCPVRRECREWALETRQEHGTWGGLTELERRRLRRSGTTLVERRCVRCNAIFETESHTRQPDRCEDCLRFTAEGRRRRNTELKRRERERARAARLSGDTSQGDGKVSAMGSTIERHGSSGTVSA